MQMERSTAVLVVVLILAMSHGHFLVEHCKTDPHSAGSNYLIDKADQPSDCTADHSGSGSCETLQWTKAPQFAASCTFCTLGVGHAVVPSCIVSRERGFFDLLPSTLREYRILLQV